MSQKIDLSKFVNEGVVVTLRNGDHVECTVRKYRRPDEDNVYEYDVCDRSYTENGKYYDHCDSDYDIVKIKVLSNHNTKEMKTTAPQLTVQRTFTVTLTAEHAERLANIIQHHIDVFDGNEIDRQLVELARQIERA
jgi:hypothetical protein